MEDSLTPMILIVIRKVTIPIAHVVMIIGELFNGAQKKPKYDGIAKDDIAIVTM